MKKICLILTVFSIVILSFAGCSNHTVKQNTTELSENTSIASTQKSNESSDSKTKASDANAITTVESKTPIEKADISSADAAEKIKAFSVDKLGLEGEKDDYKFMVSTKGKTLDNIDYFDVVASVVTEENEDGSISMETKGEYLVSYDGSKILIRDMETGEFSELK